MATFDLREEREALNNPENYVIENEHDVRSMDPGEVDRLLQSAFGGFSSRRRWFDPPPLQGP